MEKINIARRVTVTYDIEKAIDYVYQQALSLTAPSNQQQDEIHTGNDFEVWCLSKLHDLGIHAYLTPPGPDQGIDIVAHINEQLVGIQCKFYTGSVGNAAVQEALAGKEFYMLDEAVVITTGNYTKSAVQLAKMTNVVLLKDIEIYDVADYI